MRLGKSPLDEHTLKFPWPHCSLVFPQDGRIASDSSLMKARLTTSNTVTRTTASIDFLFMNLDPGSLSRKRIDFNHIALNTSLEGGANENGLTVKLWLSCAPSSLNYGICCITICILPGDISTDVVGRIGSLTHCMPLGRPEAEVFPPRIKFTNEPANQS